MPQISFIGKNTHILCAPISFYHYMAILVQLKSVHKPQHMACKQTAKPRQVGRDG